MKYPPRGLHRCWYVSFLAGMPSSSSKHAQDPLNLVPILLKSSDPSAESILDLIGQCGNAKEAVIALQEATGQLRSQLMSEEDSDDQLGSQKPCLRLTQIISLYSSCTNLLSIWFNSFILDLRHSSNKAKTEIAFTDHKNARLRFMRDNIIGSTRKF